MGPATFDKAGRVGPALRDCAEDCDRAGADKCGARYASGGSGSGSPSVPNSCALIIIAIIA